MAGIKFDMMLNSEPFLHDWERIKTVVQRNVNEITKSGESIDTITDNFYKMAISLGATAEAAEKAKQKFSEAVQEISSSSDDVVTKQQKLSEAINGIFKELSDGSSVLDEELQKKKAEADELIHTYEESAAKLQQSKDKLQQLYDKGGSEDVEEVKQALTEYKELAEETGEVASKAYEKQEEYVESLQEKIDKVSKDIENQDENSESIVQLSNTLQALNSQASAGEVAMAALKDGFNNAMETAKAATAGLDGLSKGAKVATIASKALGVALKSIGIGLVIAGVVWLATKLYDLGKAFFEESEEARKSREQMEELEKLFSTTYANSLSKTILEYKRLQAEYVSLRDEHAKTEWLDDNQIKIDRFGVAINNVSDAERFFKGETQNIVKSFMLRAQAAAYAAKAAKMYEQAMSYNAGDEVSDDEYKKYGLGTGDFVTTKWGLFSDTYKLTEKGAAYLNNLKMDEIESEINGYINKAVELGQEAEKSLGSLASKLNKTEKQRLQEQRENLQQQLDNLKEEEAIGKKGADLRKKINEINMRLSVYSPSKTSKNEKNAFDESKERLEAEQKMAELLDKQKRDQARKAEDLEFSTREAEIKAMKEGTDKTLRQLELDRDRELATIRRSYEDMRIARVEAAKKLWEADTKNKGKNFYNSNQYKNASAYTKEEKDNRLAREMAVNVNYANEEQRRIEQLIASHQSYIDKKLAIDKKYEEDVAKIDAAIVVAEEKGQTEVVEALKRTRAEAEKDRAKSQADLSLAQLKEMPEYIRAFEDLDNTSTETLEHLIEMFEKAKGAAAKNMSPDELREYTNTIQQMQDEINGRDPFKALVDSSKKVKKADQDLARAQQNLWRVRHGMASVIGTETKANGELVEVLMTEEQAEEEVRKEKDKLKKAQKGEKKAWAEVRSEIDEVASSIGNLGSAIGGEAGQILQIASSVITFTTQTIDTVKQITESISNVKKGVEATMDALQSSNAILAIIGAAYSIFQSISSLFGESEEEKQARLKREEMMRNMTSSVEQYRLEVIKARQEEEAWFASSSIMKLAQQWELSSEAQKSYYAIAKQQTEQLTKDIEHWQNGNAAFGTVWAQRAKFFQDYTASIKNAGNAFDMLIKNERDELETLSSFIQRVYGTEMFDAFGNLNTTAIDTFLADFSDRIQHDDEQILKNLNEMAKQYQEWQKALQEYVDEQYGGLSDNIVDALWAWYDDGTDVLDAFRDNARDTFRGVASDMMKELVNSLVFDSLKEKLTGLFTAYSENVNKNGMEVADALKLLAEGTEAALTEFEGTVSQELPTLTALMTQIGEMSDRLFGDGKEEAIEYFDDIRSAWVDAVTGMKGDTTDFGKEIARIMFENLVNSNIFNKEFDEWLKNWSKQYEDALKTGNEELKRDLEQQKSDKIKELTERTKEYADMTGYAAESNEELVTSLSNLRDTIIDSLLSLEDDASDIGKKVGSNLIREMLQQMLDSETYAGRMAEIKEHWQKALNGEDGYSYESVLKEIAALNNDIANDEAIGALAEQWKQLNANVEESDSVFKNLRSTFLDTLNDMEADAESFRKKLEQTMVRDVIDRQVLGRAFSFNGIDYTDLDDFVAKWNERYTKALESGNQEAIDALLDELVQVRELTVEAATELRDRLKEADEVIEDTTFKGMKDSFVSALMDMDASADDYGRTIGETLVRKIVEQFLSAKYVMPALEGLQSAFDEAMSQEGATYESVIAALSPQIEAAKGQLAEGQQIVRGIMDGLGLISGEVVEEAKEGFSDLTSAFKDALTSTEYDVATFGEQIGRTMKGQMLKAYIDREYSEQIEKANREWAEALESGDPERMEAIRQSVVALYDTIGSDDSVRSLAESLREVVEESVPENPFEELHSSFVSSLMDMEADAESFASDISRMLTEQMIEKTITDGFQEQIEDLGRRWALALETNDTAAIEAITRRLTELRDEMGKAVDPLLESIREVNVQTDSTFTSMTDSWISALMNMEGTAEQFAENVGKTMAQRIITQMVAPIYIQPVLDRLQDAFDTAISLEGATIQSVIRTLSPFIDEIEDVYNQILPIRDEIYTGFNIYHETVEEAVEEVRYALNDMKSNFVSSLMEMSSSADNFSKDISTILAQNFIENFVLGEKFNQQMEYWQSQYENIISSGMSENERKRQLTKLRNTIAAAKEGYVEEARAIQELLGLGVGNEDKKANVTIADKVTYDQMDEFTGILRAIQIAGEQRNDLIRDIRTQMGLNTLVGATGDNAMANAILTTLTTMGQATSSSGGGEVKEIRNMMIYTNQYLMDIQKSNKAIYNDFGDRLRSIDEKLSDLV